MNRIAALQAMLLVHSLCHWFMNTRPIFISLYLFLFVCWSGVERLVAFNDESFFCVHRMLS